MVKDDLVYLRHILDTTEQILSKVAGLSRDQFDADDNLRLALVHLIQTIGEAASRVSAELQARQPQIPWRQIIGMRHRIVHDYLHVDFDIVWQVASVHVGPLRDNLAKIVATEEKRHSTDPNDDEKDNSSL